MAERSIASVLTHFGTLLASPTAFLIVLIYAALWFVFERDTFDWHAIATLATWLMTLVIQRSEHRDTQAIHAKLDEVLRALEGAQTGLAKIDDEEPEDIEKYREKVKTETRSGHTRPRSALTQFRPRRFSCGHGNVVWRNSRRR